MAGPAKKNRSARGDTSTRPKTLDLPPAISSVREIPLAPLSQISDLDLDTSGSRSPIVIEIPRACLECARRDFKCDDIASLPCQRCRLFNEPCVGPLRPTESNEAGARRQVRQVKELVGLHKYKAYGVLFYLAQRFGKEVEGWEALHEAINPQNEKNPVKKAANGELSKWASEVEGMSKYYYREERGGDPVVFLDQALVGEAESGNSQEWSKESWDNEEVGSNEEDQNARDIKKQEVWGMS
ncbi:hypothetical protein K504DRAFT_91732 [Pleomassaria siparia CBS 279.74]|uniref:Zn(2)-C6 fungal-type domain-containing protein n=1 Tax=Pleomassaria siparia CBS 279.74 TaxID=1314801 RepID=A0A6G1JZ64_9PLEO|nr:hypothetical protein K504DRAFT_91732 [Pleomassaria siparia CBS 279.74]